ncbi:hypothetical protein RHMOL_Rhmol13G0036400 [Rhododendron molle]|uniref:Uncharacterized protein n=1 Tax=Rhododendron molle TaxID=49168 RepID=A0ACC0L356_RHOML|nr:hypothetical protein RHMOL_Rhmol13G0036400 [Rhododendron molle]
MWNQKESLERGQGGVMGRRSQSGVTNGVERRWMQLSPPSRERFCLLMKLFHNVDVICFTIRRSYSKIQRVVTTAILEGEFKFKLKKAYLSTSQ